MNAPFHSGLSRSHWFILLLLFTPLNQGHSQSVSLPVVSIRAEWDRTSEPLPNALVVPGKLIVSRTGSTDQPLHVNLSFSGSAANGVDYQTLPPFVRIPAGAQSTNILVLPNSDELVEGTERVIAKIRPLAATADPVFGPYNINPERSEAVVEIHDEDKPSDRATITITSPKNGAELPPGEKITIEAVAVDPKGYINRLEFYADSRLIGVSEIVFIVAPDPGTPIHHSIIWTNPPAGEHLLTALGRDADGQRVVSEPVRVVVGDSHNEGRVVLGIRAVDGVASEGGTEDDGLFRITRLSGSRSVAVRVHLEISGTAANGVDYAEIPRTITLPAERESIEIRLEAVPDKALENEETVVLTLVPPFCIAALPTPPECYLVSKTEASARAVIRDSGTPTQNRVPTVAIGAPRHGSVFNTGANITIRAEAADPDGTIKRLDLYAGTRLLLSTNADELTFVWTNPPAGAHHLTARALDDQGGSAARSVSILVRPSAAVATRELPDGYSPGTALTVTIRANPPSGTSAWALEDAPPDGWRIEQISHGGVFDEKTGKVKFGPFQDSDARVLTYRAIPPATASGRVDFAGTLSTDGRSHTISGDRILESISPYHPADANKDWRIVLDEVTAYAAAWKNALGRSENFAPISFVTRAGMIWRNGEAYVHSANHEPPLNWVPATPPRTQALASSTSVRSIEGNQVTIHLSPAGADAIALEEIIPPGWTANAISEGGVFDPETGSIRWGVFLDNEPRSLSYDLVFPGGPSAAAVLNGTFSVNGNKQVISGASLAVAFGGHAPPPSLRCAPGGERGVRLHLAGAAGQVCRIEVSNDLVTWTALNEVFLPDGTLDWAAEAEGGARFFRLRTE